jgi:hypothetical protein
MYKIRIQVVDVDDIEENVVLSIDSDYTWRNPANAITTAQKLIKHLVKIVGITLEKNNV